MWKSIKIIYLPFPKYFLSPFLLGTSVPESGATIRRQTLFSGKILCRCKVNTHVILLLLCVALTVQPQLTFPTLSQCPSRLSGWCLSLNPLLSWWGWASHGELEGVYYSPLESPILAIRKVLDIFSEKINKRLSPRVCMTSNLVKCRLLCSLSRHRYPESISSSEIHTVDPCPWAMKSLCGKWGKCRRNHVADVRWQMTSHRVRGAPPEQCEGFGQWNKRL